MATIKSSRRKAAPTSSTSAWCKIAWFAAYGRQGNIKVKLKSGFKKVTATCCL
ncbi:hypothetical protein PPEP_a2119 [Pseudoalteromonas peptidolytica F12-50-A1]|uniref:Uncharacterized protein n=1 Tax=Pseudoalteromonas peptidolytica F12-50-A1 TaxID=1315280 RepID=A0A8I0T526_9GAMM|nr:hypothetical protein [Pseudoalteromonas peptidolytica F12-50-A1]